MASLPDPEDDETGWESDERDEPQPKDPTPPLMSPFLVLPSVEAAVSYDFETYGFDLKTTATSLGLDELGVAKLINFIRREIGSPTEPVPGLVRALLQRITKEASFFEGDVFLKPSREDDPYLRSLGMFSSEDWSDEEETEERQLDVVLAQLELAKSVGVGQEGSVSAEGTGVVVAGGSGCALESKRAEQSGTATAIQQQVAATKAELQERLAISTRRLESGRGL
jgi:hypothetical protein